MTDLDALRTKFESFPPDAPRDETDISLRAYVSRIPDERLRQYRSDWSDEAVVAWDGNFRSDGCLMLVCCERDVEVGDFREMVERYIAFRRDVGGSI